MTWPSKRTRPLGSTSRTAEQRRRRRRNSRNQGSMEPVRRNRRRRRRSARAALPSRGGAQCRLSVVGAALLLHGDEVGVGVGVGAVAGEAARLLAVAAVAAEVVDEVAWRAEAVGVPAEDARTTTRPRRLAPAPRLMPLSEAPPRAPHQTMLPYPPMIRRCPRLPCSPQRQEVGSDAEAQLPHSGLHLLGTPQAAAVTVAGPPRAEDNRPGSALRRTPQVPPSTTPWCTRLTRARPWWTAC